MDALTEKYPNVTGYCYTFNNPIKLLDPDGNSPIGAAVEGISAFVVSAGVDFISNWIFEGMDYKTAFYHLLLCRKIVIYRWLSRLLQQPFLLD